MASRNAAAVVPVETSACAQYAAGMSFVRSLPADGAISCAAPNRNGAPGGQCSVFAIDALDSP